MTTQNSLFAHIVPMYGQTEVIATEALRYILQQSEPSRNALENMVRTAGAKIGSLTRFETEVGGEEGERVDLVCSDRNGTERILLEAKFWAGLTDNQPNTYIGRLPEHGHSALLFVAPAQRMETLWPELCRRAEANYTLSATSESGDLRCVAIDGSDRKMMLTSWRSVLMQMESQASIAGDRAVIRDIEQLLGLTDRMDSDAFLPIHSDELGQQFPRRMRNFLDLISRATERIRNSELVSRMGPLTSSWGSHGVYMTLADAKIWFGFDVGLWGWFRETPLWVELRGFNSLEDSEVLERLGGFENIGGRLVDVHGGWFIPIYLPTAKEDTAVLEAVIDALMCIGESLITDENNA